MENQPRAGGINRHALLMIACCAIPLALIAAVSLFRIDLGGIGFWAILLLCPLMHLFMMRGMHDHGADKACHSQGQQSQAGSLPQPEERARVAATLER